MIHEILSFILPVAQAAAEAAVEAEQQSEGIVGTLGLDLKLLIGQLVNFGIVFFVLWKWVFTPLSKKLEERRETIDKSLKQAEEIEAKHKQAEEHRLAQIEKARLEASEIVTKAQKAAVETKDQIMAEAKASAEKVVSNAKTEIEAEKTKLLAEVRQEAANMVVMATEKIIRQKLDEKKDRELIKESLKGI